MTLKIDSITSVNPSPCEHFETELTTPDGTESVFLSDADLTELLTTIRQSVPSSVSVHAIVGVIWAAWKNKVRGETVAQLLNKDIDI